MRRVSLPEHPQNRLHHPCPLLRALDALEGEAEDEGAVIRALVGDACTVIARPTRLGY